MGLKQFFKELILACLIAYAMFYAVSSISLNQSVAYAAITKGE